SQAWSLVDASAPGTMLTPLDGGPPLVTFGRVFPVPSEQDPEVVLFTTADGKWMIERPNEALASVMNGHLIELAGRTWRFSCPEVTARTAAADEAREVRGLRLHIGVSRDEEHVELKVEAWGRTHDLGARAHNDLLLTLARER